MPLCISCRGEYWVPAKGNEETQPTAAVPPWSEDDDQPAKQPPSSSPGSSGLAEVYDLDRLTPFVCARCKQSNERWHEWANAGGLAHFSRFFFHSLPWGWLALGSFALPVLAAWLVDFTPVASERIGVPLAILLIFVNFALLYALKDSLWRYDLLSRAGRGFRPQLAMLGIIFFVMALIFGLVIVFMLEALGGGHPAGIPMNAPAAAEAGPTADAPPPQAEPAAETGAPEAETAGQPAAPRIEGLLRVVTTILLALTFVNVTLSAMFMSGHDYSQWLNKEMPQPIYAQERRLLRVIRDWLEQEIRRTSGRDRKTGEEKRVETTITKVERTGDAGVILSIDANTETVPEDSDTRLRQLQNWLITADRWGRVLKMNREGTPQYITIEQIPANGANEDGQNGGDGSDGNGLVPAPNGDTHLLAETYRSHSETCISISTRRRRELG